MQKPDCLICLVRHEFHVSRRASRVRVVSTTFNESAGRYTPFLCHGVRRTSLLRCAMRLIICNRSTSAMGACFPMVLLRHRMCLVVLVYETLNVNHQLGASRSAVVRRRIAAPANKITRSMPLHVTVVQDTLHVRHGIPASLYSLCNLTFAPVKVRFSNLTRAVSIFRIQASRPMCCTLSRKAFHACSNKLLSRLVLPLYQR